MGGVSVSGECYPVLWIGQTAVITLPAEIDITNAGQVREVLLSVLNQGAAVLIADLSTTTFCDSAGVSALARTFRRADANHSEMRLVVSTPAVQRVLAHPCWPSRPHLPMAGRLNGTRGIMGLGRPNGAPAATISNGLRDHPRAMPRPV